MGGFIHPELNRTWRRGYRSGGEFANLRFIAHTFGGNMQIMELYLFEDTFQDFYLIWQAHEPCLNDDDGMLQHLKMKVVCIWILFCLISAMNPDEQKQEDTLRAKRTSRCSGCRYPSTGYSFRPVGPYC